MQGASRNAQSGEKAIDSPRHYSGARRIAGVRSRFCRDARHAIACGVARYRGGRTYSKPFAKMRNPRGIGVLVRMSATSAFA